MKLANAWWEQAKGQDDPRRAGPMYDRACVWYRAALPKLTGVERKQATERISAHIGPNRQTSLPPVTPTAETIEAPPETLYDLENGIRDARWIGDRTLDVLSWVELPRDRIFGPWSVLEGALVSPQESGGLVRLPIIPPEEYELQMVIEPKGTPGFDGFMVGMSTPAGERFTLVLEMLLGSKSRHDLYSGIAEIKHQRVFMDGNETRIEGTVLRRDEPNEIMIDGERPRHR